MRKYAKNYIGKIGNKKDNNVAANVAQLKYSNNKYYTLIFRYIYRYRLIIKITVKRYFNF